MLGAKCEGKPAICSEDLSAKLSQQSNILSLVLGCSEASGPVCKWLHVFCARLVMPAVFGEGRGPEG